MKKWILTLTMIFTVANVFGDNRLEVVTTLFPSYDFLKVVGGEKVHVHMLLPWGVEPHSYEPSPRDITRINSADILVYTHNEMEPWVAKITRSLKVDTLELAGDMELMESDHDCGHHHSHGFWGRIRSFFSRHHHHHYDPHIWTDPIMAMEIIDVIVENLSSLDPENKDYYTANGEKYKKELKLLHDHIEELVRNSKRDTIVFTGHSAFEYFSKRYNINFISPYKEFSPNSDPSPRDVALLRDYIQENSVEYIYYEELVSPRVANLLERELDVTALLLHGAHNVTKKEVDNGVSYISIMRDNIKNLKLGLEYGR